MYIDTYSEEITRKLAKLKKKDARHYEIVSKKIDWIIANPEHRYKDLHYSMKGIQRVHIGPFVLIFRIDSIKKTISFEDYDHHDKIYR
ncbi:MAG: type II toxin-antitoxin system mRNA interferase toxin, RelE/StbE family [Candidatus Aenigmarchaeota archaeon]|nr:type II toxin-antitoxin system mRNA interferase toxin, RelE/StbE family [Candidatus Aenigmarchaeota archaeon]